MRYSPLGLLDDQSRHAVIEFSVQTSIGFASMFALFVAGAQSWTELGTAAVRVLTFYSAIDCERAAFRKQSPRASSLNLWDQAIAYSGCAFLLRAIVHWQA